MRPSIAFLLMVVAGAVALAAICVHTHSLSSAQMDFLEQMQQIVLENGLTDLCLFTEARYTRHPSVADLHSAFQDHPGALDHFPTGSFMPPPPHLHPPKRISSPPVPPVKLHQDLNQEISSRPTSWEALLMRHSLGSISEIGRPEGTK